jgi:hypothetical protein
MSDGQFSSKPMRSGHFTASYSSGADTVPADQARTFLESRAVQREVDALVHEAYPPSGAGCVPLPRTMPRAAEEMGPPIASAVLVQEYLIGLIFLRVAGWLFVAFGALFTLLAIFTIFTTVRNPNAPGSPPILVVLIIAGIGLGIGGAGAWFGYFRGRVITERCWLCTHGVVWMTNSVFDCFSWADVPELYCDADAPRPAVGIRFDRNLSWISFSDAKSSRFMVKHVELCASAARLQSILQPLAEGNTVFFGDAWLDRQRMSNGHSRIEWNQVAEVHVRDRRLVLRGQDDRELATIPLEELPYPTLFMALVRAIVAHTRERR